MIRYLQPTVGLLALLLAVLSIGAFMGRDASGQADFFQPCALVNVVNPAPGASSDINTSFGIGIGDNCIVEPTTDNKAMYNFGGVVGFTPNGFEIVDVPAGTEMGSLTAASTLGLLNNGCATSLRVDFKFYDGTTDPNGPQIDPLPPGTADRMKPLGEGTPPAGANAWPSYLTELFPNADWSKLKARYLGTAKVANAGNLSVILNFLVFEPGARITDPENIDPIQGYPSVTVLQDPTAPAGAGDLINDFCSPLLSQTTISSAVRKNPAGDGVYNFFTWAVSQRDADNDGFENGLDTCNGVANVGDPRQNPDPGDTDRDGLDAACDPDPNAGQGTCAMNLGNTDQDADTWCNRSDNCPLNANTDQADDDSDAIGNACDANPTTADGAQIPKCVITPITIGAGGGNPHNPAAFRPCDPTAPLSVAPGATPAPTPAPGAPPAGGATTSGGGGGGAGGGAGGGTGGVGGAGPASGVGSLSPVDTSVPIWAAMLVAFGLIGLLGGASFFRAWAKSRD